MRNRRSFRAIGLCKRPGDCARPVPGVHESSLRFNDVQRTKQVARLTRYTSQRTVTYVAVRAILADAGRQAAGALD